MSLERNPLWRGASHSAILPLLDNQPGGNRTRYLLSPILFPTAEPPDDSA